MRFLDAAGTSGSSGRLQMRAAIEIFATVHAQLACKASRTRFVTSSCST